MVGNLQHATLAVSLLLGDAREGRGKVYLGAGLYRTAYRISGTVYKVCHQVDDDSANRDEYANFLKMRDEGFGKYVPAHDLWYVTVTWMGQEYEVAVMAMRYYKDCLSGANKQRSDRTWDILDRLPNWLTWDAGGGNVRFTPSGRIRLTDMQG